MPQSFASLHYHIIFSTKHREQFIDRDLQPRVEAGPNTEREQERNTRQRCGGFLRAQGMSACLKASPASASR